MFRSLLVVAAVVLSGCSSLQQGAFHAADAELSALSEADAVQVSLVQGESQDHTVTVPRGTTGLSVRLEGDVGDAVLTLSVGGTAVCVSNGAPVCEVVNPAAGDWTVSIDAANSADDVWLSWSFSNGPVDEGPMEDVDEPADEPADDDPSTPAPTVDDVDPAGLVCDWTAADMPAEDGCVTEYVQCGDVIEGTLDGGQSAYGYDYWAGRQALGGLVNDWQAVEGPERVYVVEGVLPGQRVSARVESCDDVWASYLVTGDVSDVCDPAYGPAGHFASDLGRLDQSTSVLNTVSGTWDVQFVIDGHPGATTSYRLTVTCD